VLKSIFKALRSKVINISPFTGSKLSYYSLVFLFVGIISHADPLPQGSYFLWFNETKWKRENTWAESSPTDRRLMLGSLYWFYLLDIHEDALLRMLGEDELKYKYLARNSAFMRVITYRIDNEDSILAIDSQWLVLYIDEDSKVAKIEILTD
jgi:hypothetical protein